MKSKLTRLTCLVLTIMLLVSVFFIGVGCQKEQLWSEQLWEHRLGNYGANALGSFLIVKKSCVDDRNYITESVMFSQIIWLDKENGIHYRGHYSETKWDDLYGVGAQPIIDIGEKYEALATIAGDKLLLLASAEGLTYDILGYDVLVENATVHSGEATFLRLNLQEDAYDGFFQGAYLVMERINVVDPIEGNPPYRDKTRLVLHVRVDLEQEAGSLLKKYIDVYLVYTQGPYEEPINFSRFE